MKPENEPVELWEVRLLTTWDDEPNAKIIPMLNRDTYKLYEKYAKKTLRGGVVCWKCTWQQALTEWWRLAQLPCYDEARLDTGR